MNFDERFEAAEDSFDCSSKQGIMIEDGGMSRTGVSICFYARNRVAFSIESRAERE